MLDSKNTMQVRYLINKYHNFFEKKSHHGNTTVSKLGWRTLQVLTGVVCYPLLAIICGVAFGIYRCTHPFEIKPLQPERIRKLQKKPNLRIDSGKQKDPTLSDNTHAAFIKEMEKALDHRLIDHKVPPTQSLLQDIEEISRLRQEKKETPALRTSESHLLARKVAKARFAYRLGIQPSPTSRGVHRTYFLLSPTGKKLGVFKEPGLAVSKLRHVWRKAAASFGIGHELVLNPGKYAQVAGEKAAYLLKKELGLTSFDIAPVKITHFTDEKGGKTDHGAFLVFCKNARLAEDAAEAIHKTAFTEDEIFSLHTAFLFDALLGNLDRNEENWMVKVQGRTFTQILLIDNSNILPLEEPSLLNIVASRARFAWKSLPVAGFKIPDSAKKIFLELLADPDKKVDQLFQLINEDPEIKKLHLKEANLPSDAYFGVESKKRMKARARIMKQELLKPNVTLADIGYAL